MTEIEAAAAATPQPHPALCFVNLPSHVLASILGCFGSGKTLSTVLLCVAHGNHTLRPMALPLCQGILVQRYVELTAALRKAEEQGGNDSSSSNSARSAARPAETATELMDVLDVIREDIRRQSCCSDDRPYQEQQQKGEHGDTSVITKFSWWCAILDYAERQWKVGLQYSTVPTQWIVWSGCMEIPYGPIQVVLTTSQHQWTAGALSYWRNRELSSRLVLTHTRSSQLAAIVLPLYGTVVGIAADARHRLYLQNRDLMSFRRHSSPDALGDMDWVSVARALIPMDELYTTDPSVALVASSTIPLEYEYIQNYLDGDSDDESDDEEEFSHSKNQPHMTCYWDVEDDEDGDWEDTVSALGELVIRIMTNCSLNDNDEHHRSRFGILSLESCLEDVYSNLEEGKL